MNKEFLLALDLLEKEKGIQKEILIEAMETALVTAYKKDYNPIAEVVAQVSRETGDAKIFLRKIVVDEIENPDLEIDLKSAKKITRTASVSDEVLVNVTPKTFGRIAAQQGKGMVVQKIREVERNLMVTEFTEKTGTIVNGTVERSEKGNVMVMVNRTEAILTPADQIPTEVYKHRDKIKIYISQVKTVGKAPQVLISRSHPNLIRCLFEQEIPEIQTGVVEIKAISREAGARTKIAVYSNDENVDAIGSCVGVNRMRIDTILDELNGEKIDIIKYNTHMEEYVKEALSPAKVSSCEYIADDKLCNVKIAKEQLSLAIGKEGQNVRLAAKLVGCKIDIKAD